jgi:hypothetical protein
MATCTSELIFGKAHMNDSGITFQHRLMLYEGHRAVLVFERRPSIELGGEVVDRWIPHPQKILEDSMIMLAAYGVGEKRVLQLVEAVNQARAEDGVLDLHNVDHDLMEKLYAESRKSFGRIEKDKKYVNNAHRWKVMACIFRHSSLLASMHKFLDYDIDVEICKSIYQSEFSAWIGRVEEWGELQ